MTDQHLKLHNDEVAVAVAPARGGDLVSLVDARTGIDVMFRSPWAGRARSAGTGSALHHPDSGTAWLEGYPGGMQLLCPNAGSPSSLGGLEHGFHGEAAVIPWAADQVDQTHAVLSVELFTAPLRIRRRLSLQESTLTVTDTVENLAPVATEFHYQHHPAFGRPLLGPAAMIETGARTFVAAPRSDFTPLEPGRRYVWPPELPGLGRRLDQLPEEGAPWAMLGWLTDFAEPWAAIRNPEIDLAVALAWNGTALPNAWLWQEFGQATGFPWFGRAYVTAIEPSNTTVSGPGRDQPMRLDPYDGIELSLRITVAPGRRPITSVRPDGSVRYR